MVEYIVDYELIPLKWRDGYGLSDIDLTEEIVRCRDCESWSGPCCGDHEQGTCSGWSAASGTTLIVTKADDFCSYGARREEER